MFRDKYGIIIQPNENYNPEDESTFDEGDSAFSTGLRAFGRSEKDFYLMPKFIKDFQLVRHPYSIKNTGTAPHNDPKATSRDAVIAFFSGVFNYDDFQTHFAVVRACLTYARSYRVNSDFLSPSNRLYLYKCCGYGEYAPPWLKIVGRVNFFIDILWACWVNPKHEVNQITVSAYVYGQRWLKLLYKLHPDLFGNLNEYFGGWRKRQEIADGIIAKVKAAL